MACELFKYGAFKKNSSELLVTFGKVASDLTDFKKYKVNYSAFSVL